MSLKTHRALVWAVAVFVLGAVFLPEPAQADSLYKSASTTPSSLFSSTNREYKPGDLITILIIESFNASSSSDLETDKETELDVGFKGFEDIFGIGHLFSRPLTEDPTYGIDIESTFEGGGSSRRSSAFTGTVTGQITETLDNGNLKIEASKRTIINGERNSVILTGTIRPRDISPANSVLSTHISNAELRYEGVGPLSTATKRGVITEFLEFIWPF
jgi:flagellar L-ring protein precursor FlgH